jgi:AcrR family transcriptional regulator
MAKGRSPRVPGGAAPPPEIGSDRDRIIDAAMNLIAIQGWRRLSMADVAAEAGLPILQVYRQFRSKPAILSAFFRRIDETVLAAPIEAEADERPRDRVFDLLMRRFDALRTHREAIAALRRDLPTDPLIALGMGARLLQSIGWMLEAGGISTTGLGGIIAVKLTTAAYLASLRVWLRDESPDLALTMAALDRRLRGIEGWYGGGRPRADEAPARA